MQKMKSKMNKIRLLKEQFYKEKGRVQYNVTLHNVTVLVTL